MTWISCLLVFLCAFALTGVIRYLCLKLNIVDHPCERRTNPHVTPRGGGLAILLVFFTGLVFYQLPSSYCIALIPAMVISIMGFWDDMRSLSARFRLSMQFICALLSIQLLGDLQIVQKILGFPMPMLGCLILCTLFIVWSTNLYNFMDGLNGLASMEALCLSGFMALLAMGDHQTPLAILWLILAFSTFGFLVWNFPHAKIFLGDAGSHFFGFSFSVLLLKAASMNVHWFWAGLIMLGYFICDATLTLMIRVWHKFSFFEAHRTHAFQMFWKKWNQSHVMVTLFIFMLNIFWLMPWGWVVAHAYVPGFLGLILSYLPLFYLVWTSRAGRHQETKIDIGAVYD